MTDTKKITTEDLQMKADSSGAVLAYGEYTLATFATWTKEEGYGNNARIYRLIESPIPGFGEGARGRDDCALELIAEADELFIDSGHAIAWALAQI